jgi:hypothetical protein
VLFFAAAISQQQLTAEQPLPGQAVLLFAAAITQQQLTAEQPLQGQAVLAAFLHLPLLNRACPRAPLLHLTLGKTSIRTDPLVFGFSLVPMANISVVFVLCYSVYHERKMRCGNDNRIIKRYRTRLLC